MTGTEVDAEVRRTPYRAILGVIFLLLFVMAYSEEIVSGVFQVLDQGETEEWRIALVVALNVVLTGLQEFPPVWVDVLSSALYTVAIGILMMSSINADPATLFSSRKRAALRRDWLRVRAVWCWWSNVPDDETAGEPR